MIYSFDIFDTLITRITAQPKGIFLIMQEKLIKNDEYCYIMDYVRYHFAEFRINAEIEARKRNEKHGKEEVTLQEIYTMLFYMCGIPSEYVEKMMEIEIEIEYQNIVPIWKNIELVKEYKKNGQIFLISDMYLPVRHIKKMLCKFDTVFEDICIIVSGEVGKKKSSGNLYQYFIEKYGIDVNKWIHIGDNKYSDGFIVEKIGGNSLIYEGQLLSYRNEQIIKFNEMNIKYQLMIGAIKRISAEKKNKELSYCMGLEVGAPILYGYIVWVLDNALNMGIKNLFFIARDGYVLKYIADIIIEKKEYHIKTHYLYGSRMAWRLPAMASDIECLKKYFCDKCGVYNIRALSIEFGVEVKIIEQFLPYKLHSIESSLSKSEVNAVKSILLQNETFWEIVINAIKEKRNLAIQYLKQEISGKNNIAFVELNGSGYTQSCLGKLLENIYDDTKISFFYSLFNISELSSCDNIFYKYSHKLLKNNDVLEMLSRAPHGQTIGYKLERQRCVPVLNENTKDYWSEKECQNYVSGICDFVDEMESINSSLLYKDYSDLSLCLLEYINKFTDRDIQKFIGDMPFSSSGCKKNICAYAPQISDDTLEKMQQCIYRGEWRRHYQGENLQCSLMRSSKEQQKKFNDMLESDSKKMIAIPDYYKLKGKIVLYGAGKFGSQLYEYYMKNKDVNVVLWVDQNYEHIKNEKVVSPREIDNVDYDYLVVGILDFNKYFSVCKNYKEQGIPNEKIL